MVAAFHAYMDILWKEYIGYTPSALAVTNNLRARGETIINDHIALRTINLPGLGVEDLAKVFQEFGYREGGHYEFVEKKLFAKHYEHADDTLPKIFISELLVGKFSASLQAQMRDLAAAVPARLHGTRELIYSGTHWPINHATYQKLYAESEYAAWLYAWGFRPNHFTVSINHLKHFTGCADLNAHLKASGFVLNASGGEIKGGPHEFLEQSSLMADYATLAFQDGSHKIPSCYVEFAKRFPLKDGKLYQGFVAASADKIFESTNKY